LVWQWILPEALGNICDSVGFALPTILLVAVRLLFLGFLHDSHGVNLEIISLEVGCLVEVLFIGIC
jgi:hypothetical protein